MLKMCSLVCLLVLTIVLLVNPVGAGGNGGYTIRYALVSAEKLPEYADVKVDHFSALVKGDVAVPLPVQEKKVAAMLQSRWPAYKYTILDYGCQKFDTDMQARIGSARSTINPKLESKKVVEVKLKEAAEESPKHAALSYYLELSHYSPDFKSDVPLYGLEMIGGFADNGGFTQFDGTMQPLKLNHTYTPSIVGDGTTTPCTLFLYSLVPDHQTRDLPAE